MEVEILERLDWCIERKVNKPAASRKGRTEGWPAPTAVWRNGPRQLAAAQNRR